MWSGELRTKSGGELSYWAAIEGTLLHKQAVQIFLEVQEVLSLKSTQPKYSPKVLIPNPSLLLAPEAPTLMNSWYLQSLF